MSRSCLSGGDEKLRSAVAGEEIEGGPKRPERLRCMPDHKGTSLPIRVLQLQPLMEKEGGKL